MRIARRTLHLVGGGALAALLCASPPARARAPDLVDLVLGYARGSWRSPVLCTFGGVARRGLRRVLVVAGPPQSEQRVDRLTFFDLEAREAERCSTALGGEAPNVIGSLLLGYTPLRPRSDTPERDFREALRAGALALHVVGGRLRIGPTSAAPDALPQVDFAGGRAELAPVEPGSDAARVLRDFGPRRSVWLRLEAADGTRLELPLVEFEPR
jgi:hypothetical protein